MRRLLDSASVGRRVAALSGALFVVLIMATPEPSVIGREGRSAPGIEQFYIANERSFQAALLLVGAAYAAFVCFLVVLGKELRRAEGEEGVLSRLAVGAGFLIAAFYVLGTVLRIAPGLEAGLVTDPASLESWARFGEQANNALVEVATFWRGLLLGSVALVILRFGGLPRWLGWLAAALGCAALLGSVGFVESPGQPAFTVLGFGSFIAFHFWVLLTSVALLVRAGTKSRSPLDALQPSPEGSATR